MSLTDTKHVKEIFRQSQFSVTSHERLFKQLRKLYEQMPADSFLKEFTMCLQVPLIHAEKHGVVENSFNFASKFIASLLHSKTDSATEEGDDDDICPFVLSILDFLFKNHSSAHQAVRFRVCQFINKILTGLGNEASMDDKLCDDITECMMERLQDKAPVVRVQAVLALHRLQDPYDVKCPVMKAMMFHMSSDPSADVRRAVINNIAITVNSTRGLMDRTHDVKDTVRRQAYLALARLSVARYSITQRVHLLTNGLKDESAIVRDCVSKVMLPVWVKQKEGFLPLLHALDCENSTEISTLALQALFKSEPLNKVLEELTNLLDDDKVIPVDKLTPENALYWRVLSEYLEAHPEVADSRPIDEPLPEILPELSTFCNYIRQYYQAKSALVVEDWVKLQHQYILTQLLELCKGFDLADEMGRTNLQNLCVYLLTNNSVSEDVVPLVVQLMVTIIPNVEDRLRVLAEAISEVREPMMEQEPEPAVTAPSLSTEEFRQRELKHAAIRFKINVVREELDYAHKDLDYVRAGTLKQDLLNLQVELKNFETPVAPSPPPPRAEILDPVKDDTALCKCLRIVREMVQSKTVQNFSAALRSLMQNFVLPCLQHNSILIRNKALEALGLFCLLDEALARENFVKFCFQIADDEVCETALKVTFDFLLFYGLETFEIREDNGEASTKKKSKKKKNLFVTDTYDDEFDTEEEENQGTHTTISSGSNGNTCNLMSMLTSLLDSAATSMRNLAMEGLCKLLMCCRISSPALLSRIILMWHSPVTEGDEQLRQPVGAFLDLYSSQCPRSQETLEQAFLPTLRTLMQAPVTSPLTKIDQDLVTRLFIDLTRPGMNKFHSKMCHIHNNLAISICNEVMDCDDSTNIGVLLRGLTGLELSLEDPVYRESLNTLIKRANKLFRTSKEKLFIRLLDKISKQIEAAADNVSMRTTEVDNTAASSHAISEAQASKGNKNSKLLHPNMHSIISRNEEGEEEEEENSQKLVSADIVIPPSPPRSQSSDEEDDPPAKEVTRQRREHKKTVKEPTSDGVFKKPPARARPVRNRGREQTVGTSSADASPAAKRRKALEEPSEPDQILNRNSKTAKNSNGDKKVSKPGNSSTRSKAAEVETQERRPKRQISPTQKGATLKTFQNIAAKAVVSQTKTHQATPPSTTMNKSPPKTMSDEEVSEPEPSETSSSGSPKKSLPVRPSTRRSVSFQLEGDSLDSPPASAATLNFKMTQRSNRNERRKMSPEGNSSGSEMISPPTRTSTRKIVDESKSSKSKSMPKSKFLPPNEPAKKNTKSNPKSSSRTDSDESPVPATRSGRRRAGKSPLVEPVRKQATPSSRTASSQEDTDSDSSPLPASRQRRLRGEGEATPTDSSSPLPASRQKRLQGTPTDSEQLSQSSASYKSFKSQSSDVDSDASPAPAVGRGVKGIEKLPARRRSALASDSEGTASQDSSPAPSTARARRGAVAASSSGDESQDFDSPVSAVQLKQKLKAAKEMEQERASRRNASGEDSPAQPAQPAQPAPTRRSLRGSGSGSESPERTEPTKKRPAKTLKSASSEGGSVSTPTQPAKKTRTATPNKDSPVSIPSRRSLRTQNETPSPRTRSGKV